MSLLKETNVIMLYLVPDYTKYKLFYNLAKSNLTEEVINPTIGNEVNFIDKKIIVLPSPVKVCICSY